MPKQQKLPLLVRINIIVLLTCTLALLTVYINKAGDKVEIEITAQTPEGGLFPTPRENIETKNYICYRSSKALKIDGKMNESDWEKAPWTDFFVDIEGDVKPEPRFKTRAKMLWDDEYFYVAAEMEEPHIWATYDKRDMVIFHENDFEVFIDPDGDTHEYYELEVNALNTQWDLLLTQPYRDSGTAINAWDIQGLKTAVYLQGSLNNPSDTDKGWTIEIAFPWEVLKQCAHKESPPKNEDKWRVNFSRVQWHIEEENGKYVKTKAKDGSKLHEDNWVWSPQGLINMHYPEMWGFVQFTTEIAGSAKNIEFRPEPFVAEKKFLRDIYYAQRNYQKTNGNFTADLKDLDLDGIKTGELKIHPSQSGFEAFLILENGKMLHIDETGHLW